jgi:hypothetical protein
VSSKGLTADLQEGRGSAPRPLNLTVSAVLREMPAAAGCASWPFGASQHVYAAHMAV